MQPILNLVVRIFRLDLQAMNDLLLKRSLQLRPKSPLNNDFHVILRSEWHGFLKRFETSLAKRWDKPSIAQNPQLLIHIGGFCDTFYAGSNMAILGY